MTTGHISFQEMSELYDGELQSEVGENAFREHIRTCGECGDEYRRLGKTMELVKSYSRLTSAPDFLRHRTMKKLRFLRRRKLALKSIPAIAASVLVVVGVGLFYSDRITGGNQTILAERSLNATLNDTERVIDIIRKHNATIFDITDSYIEGSVPVAFFASLRKELGFRKVAYLIAEEPGVAVRDWGSALEEVSAGDTGAWEPQGPGKSGPPKFINFRVFR